MNSVFLSPARHALLGSAIAIAASATTSADPVGSIDDFFQPGGVTATVENYPTLETSRQLLIAQGRAAVNDIAHNRKLTPTDDQPVVRMNRDTYYSFAVVDVSAGASLCILSSAFSSFSGLRIR